MNAPPLAILGVTRQEVRRAATIAKIDPDAKAAAIEAGIADNQSALLKVAKEKSPAAQLASVQKLKAVESSRKDNAARDRAIGHAQMPPDRLDVSDAAVSYSLLLRDCCGFPRNETQVRPALRPYAVKHQMQSKVCAFKRHVNIGGASDNRQTPENTNGGVFAYHASIMQIGALTFDVARLVIGEARRMDIYEVVPEHPLHSIKIVVCLN